MSHARDRARMPGLNRRGAGSASSGTGLSRAGELVGSASPLLYSLYAVYTVFFFLHLPARIPGIGVIRPTLLLAGLILYLLFSQELLLKKKDFSDTSRRLNILLVYMVLSLPFVKWPGSVLSQNLPEFVKAILFFFFTVKIVNTVPRLRFFLLIFIGCQVIRVYEPLLLHLTTGYWGGHAYMSSGEFLNRLSGAPKDVINPNGLSYVIITALAFMHYLMSDSAKRWHTLLYWLLVPGMLYALLLTGSRSGVVGLVVLGFIVFLKSNRKVVLLVVAAAALAGSIAVMTPDQKDRYLSIVSADAKNANTAGTRTSGFRKDIAIGLERPIFGHGVGTSLEAYYHQYGRAHVSHVMYTEVFLELGAVGVVLFLWLLWSIIKNSRQAKHAFEENAERLERRYPEEYRLLRSLSDAVEAWVGMAIVFSFAIYGLSEYNWYLVGGLSVVLHNFVTILTAEDQAPSAVPGSGAQRLAGSNRR